MKLKILLIIFLPISLTAQYKVSGVVLDQASSKPLEFVDIYNEEANTSSNENGRFEFSTKDSIINFNLLGYEKKTFSISQIKRDTIFLKKKFFELDEVIISDLDEPIKAVFKQIVSNYPLEPYSETFFMRSLLKKENEIIKLQDISGLVERQTLFSTSKNPMPKNNYKVEIKNMRKAGDKEKDIYFEMFSLEEFFKAITSLYMNPKFYDYEMKAVKDETFIKYYFKPKQNSELSSNGFYLVHSKDNAFNEYYLIDEGNNKPFKERGDIKYRTYYYELNIKFKKDQIDKKHYLDIAKLIAKVEVINQDNKSIFYEAEYQWLAQNHGDFKVDKNTSMSKDLFKMDEPYDPNFWQNQNQLLLTEEMQKFLIGLNKSEKNEYQTTPQVNK